MHDEPTTADADADADAPFIVTAELPATISAHLSALRAQFFPPRAHDLPAHLTLLHQVPAAAGPRLAALIADAAARAAPPNVALGALFSLGGGFAVRVQAPGLAALRRAIAGPLAPHLGRQDSAPFRPHITLANKLPREEARRRLAVAQAIWRGQATCVVGLARWRYLGGPWRPAGRWPLAGAAAAAEPADP